MTFREKLEQEHPEMNIDDATLFDCPRTYKYEDRWDCNETDIFCDECWNREIPEEVKNGD